MPIIGQTIAVYPHWIVLGGNSWVSDKHPKSFHVKFGCDLWQCHTGGQHSVTVSTRVRFSYFSMPVVKPESFRAEFNDTNLGNLLTHAKNMTSR